MNLNHFAPSPSIVVEIAPLAQQYRAAEASQDAALKDRANDVLSHFNAMGYRNINTPFLSRKNQKYLWHANFFA